MHIFFYRCSQKLSLLSIFFQKKNRQFNFKMNQNTKTSKIQHLLWYNKATKTTFDTYIFLQKLSLLFIFFFKTSLIRLQPISKIQIDQKILNYIKKSDIFQENCIRKPPTNTSKQKKNPPKSSRNTSSSLAALTKKSYPATGKSKSNSNTSTVWQRHGHHTWRRHHHGTRSLESLRRRTPRRQHANRALLPLFR